MLSSIAGTSLTHTLPVAESSTGLEPGDDYSTIKMDGHSHVTPPYPSVSEIPDEHAPSDPPSFEHDQVSQDEQDDPPSDSSGDDNADASADDDYEGNALAESGDDQDQAVRSASEDSQKSSKRKHAADDDDYMKNDPELYGLRRSVRFLETPWLLKTNEMLRDALVQLIMS